MAFKPDNELEEVFIIEDFDYHPVYDAIEDESENFSLLEAVFLAMRLDNSHIH